MMCLKASVYLPAVSIDLIKYITSFHKSCLMSLKQYNYSKTTTKQLLASLHLKMCYIWRYHTSLKCVALFHYLPYQKKKIFSCLIYFYFAAIYILFFSAHRQKWGRGFFCPAAMLHICKDFCYTFPQNFRALYLLLSVIPWTSATILVAALWTLSDGTEAFWWECSDQNWQNTLSRSYQCSGRSWDCSTSSWGICLDTD